MRTFTQKPKAMQQTTSGKTTIPGRARFEQSEEMDSIPRVQGTIGNQAVQRSLKAERKHFGAGSFDGSSTGGAHNFVRIPVHSGHKKIRPKLTIGAPNDIYEREADRISDLVMRMPDRQVVARQSGGGVLQRTCATCSKAYAAAKKEDRAVDQSAVCPQCRAQATAEADATPTVSSEVASGIQALKGGGQLLSEQSRAFFEPRFGTNLSQVRIHHDAQAANLARDVNARAFTVGRDVVFGASQYQPHSSNGKRLLAHELTHVMQQQTGVHDVAGKSTPRPAISRQRSGGKIIQCTPAPPSYGGVTGVRDMSKIRIDAIADFLKSDLTTERDINVHINDSKVKHMTWMFYDPNDKIMSGSFSTSPGQPNATSAPFKLKPSHFSGSGFVAGKYILRCSGLNARHQPEVYADRDFNVLSADLTTGTAKTTTYGDLTFTKYSKTDANPPTNPRYKLDVELKFLPKTSVACDDVAFIQAIDSVDSEGRSHHRYSSSDQDARKTPSNWSIDRRAGAPSPFYGTYKDPSSGALVDRGITAGKGGASPTAAILGDKPSWSMATIDHFETCVICRRGTNLGQVYGCATWGFTNTSAGKVTLMPRNFRQMPSDQFKEARAAWNTWRMTKSASTRPSEAPALKSP